PPLHPGIMASAQRGRLPARPGEQFEEPRGALLVEGERGRELPENGSEFLLQPQDARREEVRERRPGAPQLPVVGDVTSALDGEAEAGRSLEAPLPVRLGPLQRIERAVDLDRVEAQAGMLELATGGKAGGIEVAAPAWVAPAGDADTD